MDLQVENIKNVSEQHSKKLFDSSFSKKYQDETKANLQ